MAKLIMELPNGATMQELQPALRDLADRFGCDLRLAADGIYKAIPRAGNDNVVRLPARIREAGQPGPGIA